MIPHWFVAVTAPLFVLAATLLGCTCPSLEKIEGWEDGKETS